MVPQYTETCTVDTDHPQNYPKLSAALLSFFLSRSLREGYLWPITWVAPQLAVAGLHFNYSSVKNLPWCSYLLPHSSLLTPGVSTAFTNSHRAFEAPWLCTGSPLPGKFFLRKYYFLYINTVFSPLSEDWSLLDTQCNRAHRDVWNRKPLSKAVWQEHEGRQGLSCQGYTDCKTALEFKLTASFCPDLALLYSAANWHTTYLTFWNTNWHTIVVNDPGDEEEQGLFSARNSDCN